MDSRGGCARRRSPLRRDPVRRRAPYNDVDASVLRRFALRHHAQGRPHGSRAFDALGVDGDDDVAVDERRRGGLGACRRGVDPRDRAGVVDVEEHGNRIGELACHLDEGLGETAWKGREDEGTNPLLKYIKNRWNANKMIKEEFFPQTS